MSEKIISNIKPFNDVYYIDCFFNSVFPILEHFGRSIYPVLANDVFVFCHRIEEGFLHPSVKNIQITGFSELSDDLDIQNDNRFTGFDLIALTRHAVDNQRPVVVWVDCHEIEMRKDAYQKTHWAHTLLAYGYDDATSQVHVIEHRHRDNLFYKPMTMSYQDFVNGNNGYISHFHHGQFPTYHEFYVSQEQGDNALGDDGVRKRHCGVLAVNLRNHMGDMTKGMENLARFTKDYQYLVLNGKDYAGNIPFLVAQLNKVINFRTMEAYRMERLFGTDSMGVKPLRELISQWSTARLILAKLAAYGKYEQEPMQNTVDRIKQVEDLENAYIGYLQKEFG